MMVIIFIILKYIFKKHDCVLKLKIIDQDLETELEEVFCFIFQKYI